MTCLTEKMYVLNCIWNRIHSAVGCEFNTDELTLGIE